MAKEPPDYRPMQVVFTADGMESVDRKSNIQYRESPALLMDIYRPSQAGGNALPAVIFVHGDGPPEWLKDIKDWGQYVSWGQLAATFGMVAVTFNHRSTERGTRIVEAADDVDRLLQTVKARAGDYGIDANRLGIWVASAGGYLGARAAFNHRGAVRCLLIYYGLMDPIGASDADVATFSSIPALTSTGPSVFVARAGLDNPKLNLGLDAFAAAAIERGLEVEIHNHAAGHHAFDILDQSPRSKEIIGRSLEFLRIHLGASGPVATG